MEPAVPVDGALGGLRLLPVALHDPRAPCQDLVLLTQNERYAGVRSAHGAQLHAAGLVRRQHRRRLGEAVALVDGHPGGEEEAGHIGGQRRAAGDERAQSSACLVPELAEHQPVGQGEPDSIYHGNPTPR